ncbi:MAG TPA: AMP-binding protein [Thermoanaerobaculia bacterium]|nr:AMP-binding protein [Thermoanaerobaculia bacterium]
MSRPETIPRLFLEATGREPERVALREKRLGIWRETSWREYRENVERVAMALRAAGLERGDRVAILGDNAPWWLFADFGVLTAGGVSAGIYTTSSWQQCRYIVRHSGARFLFVENQEQLQKWLEFESDAPHLERVIVVELTGLRDFSHPRVMTFNQLLAQGLAEAARHPGEWTRLCEEAKPDDLALLIYTSGTTGDPKGAMLSHANLAWQAATLSSFDPTLRLGSHDDVLSFLPLCHIFERLFTSFVPLAAGYTVNFTESVETVAENMREVAPTLGYGVPRIWEKYHSRIVLRMEEATWLKRTAFRLAQRLGERRAGFAIRREKAPFLLAAGWRLADFLVMRKLKERLGFHRIRLAFSGAAPIAPDVLLFFHSIGLYLVEGYGQTEGTGVTTASSTAAFCPGMVGRPLPGVEVKIAEDGEILVRSPGVFLGYFRDEEATRTALRDGWLHSGDVGELDAGGFLRIVDRKKDLIITAGGKNIAPQMIENRLKFSPYINDAIVIGERRKFLTAMIVLDEENVGKYAQEKRIPFGTYADLAANGEVRGLIDAEVQKVNAELARVEQVRRFAILPTRLYEEEGEVTPTMKVKRRVVHEKYRALIEEMYGE